MNNALIIKSLRSNIAFLNKQEETSIILPVDMVNETLMDCLNKIKELIAENKILREFKKRVERDFTEADKMLIHIEDVKQKLKEKGYE